MNTKMINWSLVGAIVLATGLVGSVAAAQAPQSNGASAEGARRHDPASFVQRFDKNGNGKVEISELPEKMQKWLASADTDRDGSITVEELKASREARRTEMFNKADKNHDGALSADEVGKRWEHLQVADADKSGSVTRAELDQARAEGKLRGGRGHHGHCGAGKGQMFERADKNKDGALTQDEVPAKFWEHLVKADANKDGKVTREELQAARAQHGKR
jgi:Ca2+-binding EF-hand superfamily protein